MRRFKVKCNLKTPSDVKLSDLQNGYLVFLEFVDFGPPNSKFLCSKINTNKKLELSKNWNICPKSPYTITLKLDEPAVRQAAPQYFHTV